MYVKCFRSIFNGFLWIDGKVVIVTGGNTGLGQGNAEIQGRIPADRWGEPFDLMGAIVFLASRASDYVNGHVLAVDGGWLVR